MTERIDHAAEAQRVMSIMPSGDTLSEAYAYSQVHATLALVEQQRIANLIALSESGRSTVQGARAALDALYGEDSGEGSARRRLHPDIAAALGVTR